MQDLLLAPQTRIAQSFSSQREPLRRSELAIVSFQISAGCAAIFLPVATSVRDAALLTNLAVILVYVLLVNSNVGKWTRPVAYMRDWLVLGLMLLAYREMGWLALPHASHALEARWIVWDRAVLHALAPAIEAFGPAAASLLEIAYASAYALAPFCVVVLYLYRRRDRLDDFLLIFALGVLVCYAQFPLWPSEPPRVLFTGENLPAYDTVFRRFNWWMLGNYGIQTSCFPSGHVAAAFSAAFGMRRALPEHKRVSRFLIVMALLISAATVYGRYHYAADAAAGFAVALFALSVATVPRRLCQWIGSREAVAHPSADDDMRAAGLSNRRPAAAERRFFSITSTCRGTGAALAVSHVIAQAPGRAKKR